MGSAYTPRSVEKMLLGFGGKQLRKHKLTRDYIRKTAKNTSLAYKIGVRDHIDGKPAIEESMIPALSSEDELLRSVSRLAFEAYKAGYASAEGR